MRLSLQILAKLPPAELRDVKEYEFHVAVNEYARSCGWKVVYFTRSAAKGADGNWRGIAPKGWCDSFMAHPVQRRLLAAEMKSETGRVRPEQQEWLDVLAAAGAETAIWRPRDAQAVMEALT